MLVSPRVAVYLAQSFIVFYDFAADRQLLIYQNSNGHKPYRALAFEGGRLFAGEGSTKQGEIQVFRVSVEGSRVDMELSMVLRGHRYGISQIIVQEDLVVSVGDDNDKGVLVWETVSPRMLSANLMKTATVLGALFVPDPPPGEVHFVTYGTHCHLKLWSLQVERSDKYPAVYSLKGAKATDKLVPQLVGKKLLLG